MFQEICPSAGDYSNRKYLSMFKGILSLQMICYTLGWRRFNLELNRSCKYLSQSTAPPVLTTVRTAMQEPRPYHIVGCCSLDVVIKALKLHSIPKARQANEEVRLQVVQLRFFFVSCYCMLLLPEA